MWYVGLVELLFEAAATGRAMANGRSLSQFQETFPDETSCAAFLLEQRWPEGFVCPGCGGQRAAALKSRAYTYECLDCGRQTSATAGTVMHRSKLPLTTWFWAAHLMATHSNGMSARQLEDLRRGDSSLRFRILIYRKFHFCESDLPGSDQDMSRKGVSGKDGVAVILGLARVGN